MADFIKPSWIVNWDPEEQGVWTSSPGFARYTSEPEALQKIQELKTAGYKKIIFTYHPGYIIPSPQKIDIYEIVSQTTD